MMEILEYPRRPSGGQGGTGTLAAAVALSLWLTACNHNGPTASTGAGTGGAAALHERGMQLASVAGRNVSL